MTPSQLRHDDHEPDTRRSPLRLLLDDLSDPLNVGSIFRIADAMGLDGLYLCGDTACPPNRQLHRTARSTERHVRYSYHRDAIALVDELAAEPTDGLQEQRSMLIALEITDESIDIGSDAFTSLLEHVSSPCLILGSESTGVSQPLLDRADACIQVPMLGRNSSMNVATATAIACFELNRVLFGKAAA